MDQEREDYADQYQPPKRRIFSPVQKIVFAIAIACGLAPLAIEFVIWLWARWRL